MHIVSYILGLNDNVPYILLVVVFEGYLDQLYYILYLSDLRFSYSVIIIT